MDADIGIETSRRLLSGHDVTIIVGDVLGWIMAIVYVFSRVPQLYKTATTQESRDLSANMFLFTFCGNMTQFLSLVIRPADEWTAEYAKSSAPWSVNAFICAMQDLFLLVLIRRFNQKGLVEQFDGDEKLPFTNSILGTPTDRFFSSSPVRAKRRVVVN